MCFYNHVVKKKAFGNILDICYSYLLNKRRGFNKRGGLADFFRLLHEKQWGGGNFFHLLHEKQLEGVKISKIK